MPDARASVRMRQMRPLVSRVLGATMRFMRWSLATVEDHDQARVIPLPGPAHGPVPAIEVRLEAQRRKAS